VLAPALPFALDAASLLVAALLVAPLLWRHPPAPEAARRRPLRSEIGEGLDWLWHHPALRLLAVCVGVMNLAGAGSFASWVLWACERLGLHGVGFGALVTAYTLGGLLGTPAGRRARRRPGHHRAVLACLRRGRAAHRGHLAPVQTGSAHLLASGRP
jgi:hypothetical protein